MLHLRFLSYEHDLRRQIITLVYEKQQPAKPSRKKGKTTRVKDTSTAAAASAEALPKEESETVDDTPVDGAFEGGATPQ